MKKVFLDDLPRWKDGRYKGKINWKESVGYKVKIIYENIEGYVKIVDYISEKSCICVKYLDKDIYKIKASTFQKCQLGNLLGTKTSDFKIEIGQEFKDEKRHLIIVDREYRLQIKNNGDKQNWKYYKYKCCICGFCDDRSWIVEGNLLKGVGCACCCRNPRIAVQGINDIPTIAPWMVKYFQGGYDEAKLYTKSSNQKIYPICPDCGRVKSKKISINDIYNEHSVFCTCGDGISYPEKFMFSILEQLNINFTTEYSPKWISPKRYDIYFEFNDEKYIIEMDGAFHRKNNTLSGQTKEQTMEIDQYKDIMAQRYGIKVVRIDCEKSELEYIKNSIMHSNLVNIFDFCKINWLTCHEFACSNLCKKLVKLKNLTPI